MSLERATLWSILGAYLLLPASTVVDFPAFPPLDKVTISNVSAFFVCRFILGKRIKLLPNLGIGKILILIYITSPFMTAFLNPEPIIAGARFIKGMEYYDALSAIIRQSLFILPFILGFTFIRDSKTHEELLWVLAYAGLFYSLPMLFEVRFSPQLHTWVYGFFPHNFGQQMRGGGFRPVVFIGHGLLVAFFAMSSLVAVSTLWKLRKPIKGYSAGIISLYLGGVLILCKSFASLIYASLLVGLIQLASPKRQILVAKVLVLLVIFYPMLRAADWFPINNIYSIAAEFSEDRAQSLKFRLDNEEILLTHVRNKALFGWGSWGRNRVYDMESGKDLSVTDGRWIIVMGEYGWVGFLAEFCLLALPVIRSTKVIRYVKDRRERVVFGAITLLLAISIVDLLPNASVSPWTWLLAGALLGRIEQIKFRAKVRTTNLHTEFIDNER